MNPVHFSLNSSQCVSTTNFLKVNKITQAKGSLTRLSGSSKDFQGNNLGVKKSEMRVY